MWFEQVFRAYADRRPFDFKCNGVPSADFLPEWEASQESEARGGAAIERFTWRDPATGLAVTAVAKRFADFPAIDWVLWLENTGDAETPAVEDVCPLDLTFSAPIHPMASYVLHRTKGSAGDASDFEMTTHVLAANETASLQAGGDRAGRDDLPYFRIDTERGAAIVAVGWAGHWKADLACRDGQELRVRAGMDATRFKLRPGEKVRTPRVLVMLWEGDSDDSNSHFRRLVAAHYLPRFRGEAALPFLFGDASARGLDAERRASRVRALAPLGPDSVIAGAAAVDGDEAEGMTPAAAAAREAGTAYGLRLEAERVATGSKLARQHPGWLLPAEGQSRFALLDFGRPEAREHMLEAVASAMKAAGCAAYRLDFNPGPIRFWRENDEADRQGVAEMKHVEGLYEFWDRLAQRFPESFRVGGAGAGRRMDLETVARFHTLHKGEYRFHNVPDQASLFALSQYLPNGAVATSITRLDEYTFCSALPSSLSLAWPADAEGFDMQRAGQWAEAHRRLRPCFSGGWYALTKYNRDHEGWLASQYHRSDQSGLLLAFRREDCESREISVQLRGLKEEAVYVLSGPDGGAGREFSGRKLMAGFSIAVDTAPGSKAILYRKKQGMR